MRGVPEYDPTKFPVVCDVLGVAIRQNDRVCYCRCGDTGLTVGRVLQLAPEILVFEPDAQRYVRIFDSRQVVVVRDAAEEMFTLPAKEPSP